MRKLRAISLLPLLFLYISQVPDQHLCHYPVLVCSSIHCRHSRKWHRGVFVHHASVWFGFTPFCSPTSDLSLSFPSSERTSLMILSSVFPLCFHYILPSFLFVFWKTSNCFVYAKPVSRFVLLFLPLWKVPEQDPHLRRSPLYCQNIDSAWGHVGAQFMFDHWIKEGRMREKQRGKKLIVFKVRRGRDQEY